MKRSLPPALGVVCFLLLGVVAGFAHRRHDQRAEVLRVPVEHVAACLEALVHLRLENAEGAAAVLRRHVERFRDDRRDEAARPAPWMRSRVGGATAGISGLAVAAATEGGSTRGGP